MATNTATPPLRLGVVGSGFAARTIVAAVGHCDIVVAGVTGGSRAAELAASVGASHFADLPAMLPHVDAVMVASPHDTHADYCRTALLANCHVLCEKPFVLDSQLGQEIIELARARGLVLSVNHFQRYRIPNAAARDHLLGCGSGVLGGHCRLIETPMTKPWQLHGTNFGFLFGYGVHAIDLLCWWLSDRVSGVRARSSMDARGVEHTTSAILRFSRGAEVHLVTSDEGPRPGGPSQVGRAVFNTLLITQDGLVEIDSYGEAMTSSLGARTFLGTLPAWEGFEAPERLAAYSATLAQFARACLLGVPVDINPEDMLHGVRVCEAALMSATKNGAEICV